MSEPLIPLIDVINDRRPCRADGIDRWICDCPFCEEDDAVYETLVIHPAHYECIRCFASGDALSFVMRVDGVGFMQAVEKLARQMGLEP